MIKNEPNTNPNLSTGMSVDQFEQKMSNEPNLVRYPVQRPIHRNLPPSGFSEDRSLGEAGFKKKPISLVTNVNCKLQMHPT